MQSVGDRICSRMPDLARFSDLIAMRKRLEKGETLDYLECESFAASLMSRRDAQLLMHSSSVRSDSAANAISLL